MVGSRIISGQHRSWYARGVYVIMATRRGMKKSSSKKKKDDDKKKKKSRRRG